MGEREAKRDQFTAQKKKSGKGVWIVVAVASAAALLAIVFVINPASTASGTLVQAENGKIAIPLAEVSDGKAHYYSFDVDGTTVDFFMLKSVDGQIRVALDACDVCYKSLKGYRQEGAFMVCNNCGQKFSSEQINIIKGGCNPAPLSREVTNGQVVVLEQDLRSGRPYFSRS